MKSITKPTTTLAPIDSVALARVAGGNGKKRAAHAVGNAASFVLTGESADEVMQQRVRDSVMQSGQRAIVRPVNGAGGRLGGYGGFQGMPAPALGFPGDRRGGKKLPTP